MKTVKNNHSDRHRAQGVQRAHRPEIRDELDSRVNEEQDDKGNDVAHNHKETKRDKHPR